MNLKDLDITDAIVALVSAGHLQLGQQFSYEDLRKNMALYLAKAGYYGTYDPSTKETNFLENSQTAFVSSGTVQILIEGYVVLPVTPSVTGGGSISYFGKGILEVGGAIIYDGRSGSTSFSAITGNASDNASLVAYVSNQITTNDNSFINAIIFG